MKYTFIEVDNNLQISITFACSKYIRSLLLFYVILKLILNTNFEKVLAQVSTVYKFWFNDSKVHLAFSSPKKSWWLRLWVQCTIEYVWYMVAYSCILVIHKGQNYSRILSKLLLEFVLYEQDTSAEFFVWKRYISSYLMLNAKWIQQPIRMHLELPGNLF